MSLPRSAVLYALGDFIVPSAGELAKMLAEVPLVKPSNEEIHRAGFVNSYEQSLVFEVDGALFITMGTWERKLPMPAIRAEIEERCEKMEKATGIPVYGRKRREVRHQVIQEHLPHVLPTPGRVHAIIDPPSRRVYVEASSHNKAEGVISMVRKALGSFPVVPVTAGGTPAAMVMTNAVANNQVPDGLVAGHSITLEQRPSKVTAVNVTLEGEALRSLLSDGYQVTRAELYYGDRVEFTLDDDLVIRKLKFLEAAMSDSNLMDRAEKDGLHAANSFLAIKELRSISAILNDWFSVP